MLMNMLYCFQEIIGEDEEAHNDSEEAHNDSEGK
jgi:hypothetical protein